MRFGAYFSLVGFFDRWMDVGDRLASTGIMFLNCFPEISVGLVMVCNRIDTM
jgi:hypothetical protein